MLFRSQRHAALITRKGRAARQLATNFVHGSGERRGLINRGDWVDCLERPGSTPRWTTNLARPREFGVLPTKQIRRGSTPRSEANFSRPADSGSVSPKDAWDCSTQSREANHAAQAQIAGQVLGKDE